MNNQDWHQLHDELRDGLEQEVRLTRELLANLRQEEVSLMLHDTGTLNHILQMRSQMLEKLSSLRLQRMKTTESIEKIVASNHKAPTIEEVLPPNEEISSEILSLSEQLMALTEKMHRQQTLNQHIEKHGDHAPPPSMQNSSQVQPKRKASVATFHLKK